MLIRLTSQRGHYLDQFTLMSVNNVIGASKVWIYDPIQHTKDVVDTFDSRSPERRCVQRRYCRYCRSLVHSWKNGSGGNWHGTIRRPFWKSMSSLICLNYRMHIKYNAVDIEWSNDHASSGCYLVSPVVPAISVESSFRKNWEFEWIDVWSWKTNPMRMHQTSVKLTFVAT